MHSKLAIASAIATLVVLVIVGKLGTDASKDNTSTQIEVESTQTEIESTQIEVVSGKSRVKESFSAPKFFDVPLTKELQLHIFAECEKYDIEPSLVIAMIERESYYNPNTIGDGGNSIGLMQIQPKWHQGRMDKLGCTDLFNPFENVTVGIDLLAELKATGKDIMWVLMAYNGGVSYANGREEYSNYAKEVYKRALELEEQR